MNFEEVIEKLEKIVSELDNKDIPLESALKLMQEGTLLAQDGLKAVSDAKGQITLLQKELDKVTEVEFNPYEEQ